MYMTEVRLAMSLVEVQVVLGWSAGGAFTPCEPVYHGWQAWQTGRALMCMPPTPPAFKNYLTLRKCAWFTWRRAMWVEVDGPASPPSLVEGGQEGMGFIHSAKGSGWSPLMCTVLLGQSIWPKSAHHEPGRGTCGPPAVGRREACSRFVCPSTVAKKPSRRDAP